MKKIFSIFARCLLPVVIFVQSSLASTIKHVDIDYLLANAELVFEGEVVSIQSRWNTEQSTIFTHVVIQVDEVISGNYSEATIALKFAGGVVGNRGMKVSSMVYPELGEQGIYFVENLQVEQVNPLLGWGQGHFVVKNDGAGQRRVLTETGVPVLSVAESVEQSAGAVSSTPQLSEFSEGVAKGLQVGSPNGGLESALSVDDFKNALKFKLKNNGASAKPASQSGRKQ